MDSVILYRQLIDPQECKGFLATFERYQEMNKVLRRKGEQYIYQEDHFIDDWDADKKADVERKLAAFMGKGGAVVAAFDGKRLAGFANIDGNLFGSGNQYLELIYMHVSRSYRHGGIGRVLFAMCCDCARQRGAQKLYISSHPAIETQQFYQAVGCVLAIEVDESIYEQEPLDIQLEYVL